MAATSSIGSKFTPSQPFKRNEPIGRTSTTQTAFMASACAMSSFIAEAFCYPFDTVKVRLQTNREQFTPYFKAARTYYREEGIRTFFKGFSGAIPCTFLYNFVWFFCYENFNIHQSNLLDRSCADPKQREKIKEFIPFVSGVVSELAAMCMYLPFSIPKLRMQVDNPKFYYQNLIDGLVKVYRNEGISKFFKTSQLELTSNVIQCGVMMAIYEHLRKLVLQSKQEKAMDIRETLLVTMLSNVACGVMINPIEVIISRFIIAANPMNAVTYSTLARELIVNEGFRGFFKGLTGRLIYGLSHSLLYMPIFEHFRGNYGVKLD